MLMAEPHDIDFILRHWPFKPGVIDRAAGRRRRRRAEVLQMRIEMGLLQMETTGRPDGEHPGGMETCLDWLARAGPRPGRARSCSTSRSAWRWTAS